MEENKKIEESNNRKGYMLKEVDLIQDIIERIASNSFKELIPKPSFSLNYQNYLGCFHNQRIDWSLKIRNSKKQIMSFRIG